MLLFKLKNALCFAACMLLTGLSASSAPGNAQDENNNIRLNTVVLDPGHGGKDNGAPGQTSATSEKHIVLKVSKLLGEKISKTYPDVKVIYTRSKDVFVELNERAEIAKRNKADLFISIHCNSNSSKSPYGASVHILGPKSNNKKNNGDYFQKSMSVAQRENSVMLLEDDYKTKYEGFDPDSPESIISHSLMWNANYESSLVLAAEVDAQFHKSPFRVGSYTGIHQDVFYLLWATNMPAVLLELGFISNPQDFKYLSSEWGQQQMAQRLFEAFKRYKSYYEGGTGIPVTEQIDIKPEKTAETETADVYYGVQIMGLGRLLKSNDPALKGLSVKVVKSPESNIYKYITAYSDTRSKAASQLSAVRKKFPEAFIVRVEGDKVTRN